jgi:hypothetical protein
LQFKIASEKLIFASRDKEIRDRFRLENDLLVDKPKPDSGTIKEGITNERHSRKAVRMAPDEDICPCF